MANRLLGRVVLCGMLTAAMLVANECPAAWRAGVARVKITPRQPMWMSGFASRVHAAEGTLTDLWAKALVLDDGQGERALMISLDLVGIDCEFSQAVCDALRKQHGFERRQIALCCSHTHSGPVVGTALWPLYFSFDDAQRQLVADYTSDLKQQLIALAGDALANSGEVRVAWGNGFSSLAVNRRNNREADVPRLREAGQLAGPVDHDVPVLAIRAAEGKLLAIVFGYACHATALSGYEWSGDYPGYAQLEVERLYPGATALFFAGCGGDQNPLPRQQTPLAEPYGQALARSVAEVLRGPMTAVEGRLATSYEEIPLAFASLPSHADLEEQVQSKDKYVAARGRGLLAQVDAGRPLSASYPYPLQLWKLGSTLQWVLLGGEVTVDYSLRLKRELGREQTWVTAYSNDVMAYIPSLRVLREGRYEGGGAMVYYGLPAPWSTAVEESIVAGVLGLAGAERQAATKVEQRSP